MNQQIEEYRMLKQKQDASSFDLICSSFKSYMGRMVENYEQEDI